MGATQLADGAVTSTKIAPGAVGLTAFSAPLQALVVGMNVTYEQAIGLLPTAGAGLLQNATSHTLSVAVDQRVLTINGQNQLTVGPSAITAQYIAPAAVTAAQVASAAVTTAAIANAAVTTAALGPDVLSELTAINSTAQAAWLSRPVTGSGITVQNGRVSVDYNTTAFTITSANALTIAPHSISSAQVQPYSIPLSALAVDFLSLIPTPGVGIALVNESFNLVYNHSSFTVNNDALTLLPASVTSAHIAPGAVTMAALGTDVAATLKRDRVDGHHGLRQHGGAAADSVVPAAAAADCAQHQRRGAAGVGGQRLHSAVPGDDGRQRVHVQRAVLRQLHLLPVPPRSAGRHGHAHLRADHHRQQSHGPAATGRSGTDGHGQRLQCRGRPD